MALCAHLGRAAAVVQARYRRRFSWMPRFIAPLALVIAVYPKPPSGPSRRNGRAICETRALRAGDRGRMSGALHVGGPIATVSRGDPIRLRFCVDFRDDKTSFYKLTAKLEGLVMSRKEQK
jgi:hypothetical protein